MAVQTSGVKLELQGYSTFLSQIGSVNAGMGTFGAAVGKTSKELTQLGIASQQLKIETLTGKIANQQTQLGILQQKLAATTTKYGENSIQAKQASLAVDKLDASIKANSANLGIQKNKLDAMKTAEAAAETETKELTTSVTKFSTTLTTSSGKIGAWENITTGAFRKVGEIAVEGFAKAGQAIVGFLGDSIGVAGDFQASMGRFESITGPLDQAGQSAEDFSKKFVQLGMDTKYSAQEASNAASELAKGGVSVGEIMGGATDATLALASAGELQLAPAAEIVAKQLGVWKDQGVNATQVVDQLSQAASASTVNVDDLALGMANVGGVAKAAGLTFDETVTALALISPGFSSASDAATSLKTALTSLQPKSADNISAMKDLGLYTDEAGSAFYDATGSFVGLEKATELLTNATKDLNEEDKLRLLNLAFGQDGQRAALGIIDQGTAGLKRQTEAQAALGSAAEQSERKNKGFNFAMDQLKGSIETAQIVIGSKFLPAGEKLINNFLIPAVNATMGVADALEGGLTFAANNAIPILSGLTAAGIAFAAPALAASAATGAWGLTLVLAAHQATTAALAFAAAAIPLAAIAVSVGAIAFAFIDFNKKVSEGRERVKELADGYQAAVTALQAWEQASTTVKSVTKDQADEVAALKARLDAAIDRYTAWYSFLDGSDSAQRQIAEIQELNRQLEAQAPAFQAAVVAAEAHEQQLADQTALYNSLEAGTTDATGALTQFTEAEQRELEVAKLSTEEKEAFNKQIAEIREKGPGTYDSYLQSFVDYTAGVQADQAAHNEIIAGLQAELEAETDATLKAGIQDKIDAANAGYASQQRDAAIAYGEQQAAQRAHLGQMLIDYTQAQGVLNGVAQSKIDEMTALLATEYGVQQSLSERTFSQMTGDIDAWAASGGKNSEQVITDLAAASDQAAATQRQMDELAGEYTTELIQNFNEGKIDADELAEGIANIPRRVNINVHTSYTSSGGDSTANQQYAPVPAYNVGTDRVPEDQLALIHKDEAVLAPDDAAIWRSTKDMLRKIGTAAASSFGAGARPVTDSAPSPHRAAPISPPPGPMQSNYSVGQSISTSSSQNFSIIYNNVATPPPVPQSLAALAARAGGS